MFKLYIGILASFVNKHCNENNVITKEQAGGKKDSWGCAEQLLINKAATEECKNNRRNMICVWLDYKKAFDSIPHEWIIKALRLAKIPENVILAIEQHMKMWVTKVFLNTDNGQIETEMIKFQHGILQGDLLSLILFIPSVNPLSFLIQKCDGYTMGTQLHRDTKLTQLFFVDDLKLFSNNMNTAKQQMDIVTTFSKDINMQFGLEKCAYINIERGQRKSLGQSLVINNVVIKELEDGDTYIYLGQDESVSYDGPLNKDRVTREYLKHVKMVWNSQLSSANKSVSHNVFAVPVITPTTGILNWTRDEVDTLDVRTRKYIAMSGSLHKRSDVE